MSTKTFLKDIKKTLSPEEREAQDFQKSFTQLRASLKEKPLVVKRFFEAYNEQNEDGTLTFSFSSELPCMRWWGWEILSHDPRYVNLERAHSLNVLWNHNQDIVLGRLTNITIKDGRGICTMRWSNKQETQGYKQDVEDNIISSVSVAYEINDMEEITEGRFLCSWTPLEVSFVSVPADPTVGVGRAHTAAQSQDNLTQVQETNIEKMEIVEIREQESKRIASIYALARSYGNQELADKLVNEGASIEAARSAYLEVVTPASSPVAAAAPLGLSDKEQQSYSLLRAIQATLTNNWSKAGFERECSEELAKRAKKSPQGNSFFMPVRDLKVGSRATYAVGADSTGGHTVETQLKSESFIEALRNRAVIMQLGAQMLTGLQGDVDIPAQNGLTTTYWVGESDAVTQSEATFRQVALRPKTIGTLSKYTRLTLLQSSIDMEQFIRREFARQIALGIDMAAIAGTGLNDQPTGILNTAGIGAVVGGTDGAAPTWNHIVSLETEVAVDNADVNTCHYLTNAKGRGKLKRTEKFATTNGSPIWEVSGTTSILNGYQAHMSNQVPGNLTKGNGSNLSAILFGDFSQLIIGEWGVLEILVNPYGDADYPSGNVSIRALQTLDVAVRHAQSFAAMTDAITT